MATLEQATEGLRAALKAGNTPLAQAIKAKIEAKEYDDRVGLAEAVGVGAAQGATLGFADEGAAAVRAGLGEVANRTLGSTLAGFGIGMPGMEDASFGERRREYLDRYSDERGFGERYQDFLGQQREQLGAARRDRGGATLAGEIVGGLGAGGAGAGRALAGRGLGSVLARGTALGAGTGAVAGAGYSEGGLGGEREEGDLFTDQQKKLLQDGAVGALMGGAAGALTPLATSAVGTIGKTIRNAFSDKAQLTEMGKKQIGNALRQDIENGHITLEQARKELAEVPGMTIADLGPELRRITEQLVTTQDPAGQRMGAALLKRNAETSKRLFPAITRAMDLEEFPEMAQAVRNLTSEMRAAANEMYPAAYQEVAEVTPRMATVLRNSEFQGAGEAASRLLKLEDALPDVNALRFNPPPGPMSSVGRIAGDQIPVRNLDMLLQGMDSIVDAEFRRGDPKVAAKLKKMRDTFRDDLYNQPGGQRLARARQHWAGGKKMNEAVDSGYKALRMNVGEHRLMFNDLKTEGEKVFHRLGILEDLTTRMRGREKGELSKGNITAIVNGNHREIIKTAFGGKTAEEILGYIDGQQKLYETFWKATGGSPTARRQMGHGIGGNLAALVGYVASLGTNVPLPPSLAGYFSRQAYERGGLGAALGRREAVRRGGQAEALLGTDVDALMRATRANPRVTTPMATAAAVGAQPAVQGLLSQ
jgi:hypothetical protein